MARSGYEAAKVLVSHGCEVLVTDMKEQKEEQVKELESLNIKVVITNDPVSLLDNTYDYVVKNPGIKLDHPICLKAQKLGIKVVCEVEVAYSFLPNVQIIGITGSNGKTTTTTIISKLLEAQGYKTWVGGNIGTPLFSNIEEISGEGVCAVVDGKKILAGNSKLMKRYSIGFSECHKTGTIIHIAIDGEYSGHIVISDVEKDESKYAVEELKKVGVKRIVMLTGDSKKVAESVAGNLVIDEYFSELLPQEKVLKVEGLLASKNKDENLAFVGDGINDAPVLARSDIGIAMGACGSDAAIEASDVVLMDDNPLKIAKAIKISKKCMNIVRENIIFALSVKFICLVLGALGFANMWVAVFADVGVMLIAILNALRALRVKFR